MPTNVHEILERVRLLVQSEFPEGLKVVRDYDISVPEMMADRGQLTQISLNLMRNAAEALSEQIAQGTACITLKTRVVHHVQVGQSFSCMQFQDLGRSNHQNVFRLHYNF